MLEGVPSMRTIDLRSDTVTLPSPEMRAAMADAALGDDVYGEDPTVKRLEALAAERLGKAAAVFVASGTMGNLCALLAHCGRGDEAIMGDESHIYNYEAGGCAALGGIMPHVLPTTPDGELALELLASALRPAYDSHAALTQLVCLENTHNRCGGVVLRAEYMRSVWDFAQANGLKIHMDGARVFNAAVAASCAVREIAQYADSVTFCLSKGLAAPVGSVLTGDAAFIQRARRARKILGGGMRQAGVIAAAGIVALETMVDRLAEDHANARILAQGLAHLPQIEIDLATVQTDIVIFRLRDTMLTPEEFLQRTNEHGLKLGGMGGGKLRAVTHYGIDAGDIEEALDVVQRVLKH
jgi:threonine aldolase